MTDLRTQAFVHGRTAQRRECCIDFGTCEHLVQTNMLSLSATSNHANLVTSPWRLAEDRNLRPSGVTAHWHPSFKSSQRYGLKFLSSAIWHRENFLGYHKNGDSIFFTKELLPTDIKLYAASYFRTLNSSTTSLREPYIPENFQLQPPPPPSIQFECAAVRWLQIPTKRPDKKDMKSSHGRGTLKVRWEEDLIRHLIPVHFMLQACVRRTLSFLD